MKKNLIKVLKLIFYLMIGHGGLYLLIVVIGGLSPDIMEWTQIQRSAYFGMSIAYSAIAAIFFETEIF